MSPTKVSVCPLGVSDHFKPIEDPDAIGIVRARYRLPERYILYVGAIQPRKNLPRLIDAFGDLCAMYPHMPHELVIAGKIGWLEQDSLRAASDSNVRSRISMIGYVDEADMPALFSAADALALVSLWEGFGLPALEAMACGTPVLASNCSSLPEVVGDAGVLVDPYDTNDIRSGMGSLLLDENRRSQLSKAARQRAAAFTWDAAASILYTVLKDVARDWKNTKRINKE